MPLNILHIGLCDIRSQPPPAGTRASGSATVNILYLAPAGVLHLVPRSAGHTTCSGLRPTISCGQGSAYLLHIAPSPGGTTSCAIDHGHLLYLGGSAPRYYILCCKNTTLLHIGGRPPGSALRAPPHPPKYKISYCKYLRVALFVRYPHP